MPDHQDLYHIRNAMRIVKEAVADRLDISDDELKSFRAAKSRAVGLLDDDEISYLEEVAERAMRLHQINGSLAETGAPAQRWALISWFREQEPALNRLHPDLIIGS